jgi:hypothetical protein
MERKARPLAQLEMLKRNSHSPYALERWRLDVEATRWKSFEKTLG